MNVLNYFIDTSALFKRYVFEKGSQTINHIFAEKANRYISVVTLCEVTSNLRRLVDVDKILYETEFTQVKSTFLGEIGNEILDVIDLTPSIILKSMDICSENYVTPLDAIQLASALTLKERPVFVCSDKKLLRSANQWGLSTIDPVDQEEAH